jgi:hypothetical protein
MKRKGKLLVVVLLTSLSTLVPSQSTQAAWWEVVRQVVIKVILAIDAQVQRLQNKTIGLQNAQKALENALSKLKLEEIGDWGEKQRALYANYYEELWKVKNALATYKKVKELIEAQRALVKSYQRGYQLFRQDDHFTPQEIEYMGLVYSGMLAKSLETVDQLLQVVQSFTVQMSDGERWKIIDQAAEDMKALLSDLRRFNQENVLLSVQRSKDKVTLQRVRMFYGILSN